MLLTTPAFASVLTVGTSGEPFTTMQDAIDAAVDGDVILVHAGLYTDFDIDGKALTLVGENAIARGISRVRNLPAGETVTLSTLTIQGSLSPFPSGLQITACDGIVRVQDFGIVAAMGQPAIAVVQSSQVCVARCVLTGAGGASSTFPGAPAPALRIENATVAIHSTTTTGGTGTHGGFVGPSSQTSALPGAPACELRDNARLFVSGSLITGGTGGTGASATCFPQQLPGRPGADGANTIELAATAHADLHEAIVVPGGGGAGGPGTTSGCVQPAGSAGNPGLQFGGAVANVTTFAGFHRRLTGNPIARDGQNATLTFFGGAGDSVILVWARNASHQLFQPFSGVITYATPLRRLPMGTISGSGSLTVDLPIAELGTGVESSLRYVQGVLRDTTTGAVSLTDPLTLVMLDAAF